MLDEIAASGCMHLVLFEIMCTKGVETPTKIACFRQVKMTLKSAKHFAAILSDPFCYYMLAHRLSSMLKACNLKSCTSV